MIGTRVRTLLGIGGCAVLLAGGISTGSAFASGPKPDPPPPAPIVQAPPPPVPVQVKKSVHRKRTLVDFRAAPEPARLPPSERLALSGASVGSSSSDGASTTAALLIVGLGLLVGLAGAGVAYASRAALLREAALRLEPHRHSIQTILFTGLAIGIACLLVVGILAALAG